MTFDGDRRPFAETHQLLRSYVTASILESAAFQEALINEVLLSAAHDNLEVGGELGADERRNLADAAAKLDPKPTLDKYQAVLELLGRRVFDRGAQPFQNADLLVRLRNALLHYKPRWRPGAGSPETTIPLDQRLQSKGFPLNPLFPKENPFFPDRCLSHGCAEWAIRSAVALTDDFLSRLGVSAPYQYLNSKPSARST